MTPPGKNPKHPPDLLRPKQVAEWLGVSPRTISNLVMRGEFPPPDVKAGMRIIRWKASTVQAWIDSGGVVESPATKRPGAKGR